MSERTATVSYIPAIHRGYIEFMRDHPDPLYVLGEDVIRSIPRLDRDIRALHPSEVVITLGALGISKSVEELNIDGVAEFRDRYSRVILPDESANRTFADDHLNGVENVFVPTFLRWDMKASSSQFPIESELAPLTEQEETLLRLATEQASLSPDWWRQVGTAVLTQSEELLTAYNTHFPSPDYSLNTFGDPRSDFNAGERIEVSTAIHAEAHLIAQAARSGTSLEGAKMVVTTFPCPNCAKLIAEAGIGAVLYEQGYSLLDAEDTLKARGVTLKRVETPILPESE